VRVLRGQLPRQSALSERDGHGSVTPARSRPLDPSVDREVDAVAVSEPLRRGVVDGFEEGRAGIDEVPRDVLVVDPGAVLGDVLEEDEMPPPLTRTFQPPSRSSNE
jgi:hypothetical protein